MENWRRQPINRNAMMDVVGQAEHYQPKIPPELRRPHFKNRPRCVKPAEKWIDRRDTQFGRLTVVGVHEPRKPRTIDERRMLEQSPPMWVVRCACGDYELRSDNEVANPKTTDCCMCCEYMMQLRKK